MVKFAGGWKQDERMHDVNRASIASIHVLSLLLGLNNYCVMTQWRERDQIMEWDARNEPYSERKKSKVHVSKSTLTLLLLNRFDDFVRITVP